MVVAPAIVVLVVVVPPAIVVVVVGLKLIGIMLSENPANARPGKIIITRRIFHFIFNASG